MLRMAPRDRTAQTGRQIKKVARRQISYWFTALNRRSESRYDRNHAG